MHSLLGDIYDRKNDTGKAVSEYELAKKACGLCNEAGQQIAFFNLGAAYASLKPPRKSEAMAQLQSFQKMICKGAAAQRYADQCTQAQQLATKLGGTLSKRVVSAAPTRPNSANAHALRPNHGQALLVTRSAVRAAWPGYSCPSAANVCALHAPKPSRALIA